MKTPTLALLLLISCLPCTFAAQREFKVHGDQTLVTELKDGLPVPATKDGVTCCLPAFVAREGEFAIQFSVEAQSAIRLVSVDDVTGATEEHILASGPRKEDSVYWMDVSAPRELSKGGAPWVFERGDTLRVYRLRVELKGKSEPVELLQPVIWNAASKKQLRKLAK